MKKKSSADKVCEPRAEYDLGSLLPDGTQGKYVDRYRMGSNLILLEPDVAKAFPDQDAVNAALRLVMQLSSITQQRQKSCSTKKTGREKSLISSVQ